MFLHGCIPFLEIEVIYIFSPCCIGRGNNQSSELVPNDLFFRMIDITWLDNNFYLQTVELDPMIVDIARDYFSFVEDKRVKVVIYTFMSFS